MRVGDVSMDRDPRPFVCTRAPAATGMLRVLIPDAQTQQGHGVPHAAISSPLHIGDMCGGEGGGALSDWKGWGMM